jgi:cytoskeletal protein CcmA (bactofilin family)
MADQDNEVRTEPPAALPLKAEAPSAPPASLRPATVARPAREAHLVSNPGGIGSPEGKKLIVGREIELSGNISACDRLVVEGRVEAELQDCREIEIAGTGTFKGSAAIEMAEISGNFEGTLTARDTLVVRSSGRVTGKIRFGKLEIERGGEVVGDIGLVDDDTGN